ncbi:MAG TPA: glycoside hydrolase family 127 protein [Planctomycetes bacterium]|nr:glycoside hydrolase family 127 protein [Planctomycetota bacterium]
MLLLAFSLSLLSPQNPSQPSSQPSMKPLRAIPFEQVRIEDAFWGPRLETTLRVTTRHCLDKCEETGRIQNFDLAAGKIQGEFRGRLYDDSDVYKVIEGAAYALQHRRDAALEKRVEGIIARIAAAQGEDGYLNCYYSTKEKGKRWTNLRGGHELYCAGHLIEAGIAWFRATRRDSLLKVARCFADLIDATFGPEGRRAPPGHQEIELALFKLARLSGEERYARLARFFLDARGHYEGRRPGGYGSYAQDHLPVRKQRRAVGHAVRAMYQSCALTDLALLDMDPGKLLEKNPAEARALRATLQALWDDVHLGKIYITGGIGSVPGIEGFGPPFVLPNDTAYTETCAAIALSLWNERMLLLTGEARYADDLERSLYNGMLSGVSLSGDRFFYDNPLGSRGGHARAPWFSCACCPTNLVRFLPSLGGRIWAYGPSEIRVAQWIGSSTTIPLADGPVRVELRSELPWEGRAQLRLHPVRKQRFALYLREPSWCRGEARLQLNGSPIAARSSGGWLRIERVFAPGDRIRLDFPMEIRRVHDDPRVLGNRGRVALCRGPLVYCLEGADHGGHCRNLVLPDDSALRAVRRKDLFTRSPSTGALLPGGLVCIEGPALARQEDGSFAPTRLRAIPYFAWNNRGPGELVTWIPRRKNLAERPGQGILLKLPDRELEASHCYPGDRLAALMDGKLPKSSSDRSIPRMTFWPLKGATGQLFCRFDQARRIESSAVYWFDDRPGGGCRVPASYQLYYRDGPSWTPVRLAPGSRYSVQRDRLNPIHFAPVRAREWMLEIQMQKGASTGLLEWRLGDKKK